MSAVPLAIAIDADGCAEISVDGTIDGRPYRFLLDTGTGHSQVALDLYTATLPVLREHRSSGLFASSDDVVVRIPDLTVGPMLQRDVEIIRAERSLLGMDVLREHVCDFRFGRRALEVDERDRKAAASERDLHVDDAGHPHVDVELGDFEAEAVWDSGAGITLVDAGFVAAHPELFRAAGVIRGTDATGAERATPRFEMAALRVGDIAFARHSIVAVDLTAARTALILGWSTIKHADWLFDFPARRWAVAERS